jgi:2-phosphosulfolactate phosphatase
MAMATPTFSYRDPEGADGVTGTVVVIDVLRAFTTAAWARHLGASHITLVADLAEALAIKAAEPGTLACCDGRPREGFDLHNSPVQIQSLVVAGRHVVQRTTNGTQGAVAARDADLLLCASLVVASGTARRIRVAAPDHVTFVVTGGDEDRACAEHIAALVAGEAPPSDTVDRVVRSSTAADLLAAPARGYTGVDLGDVDACAELDRFDFALEVTRRDGRLVIEPPR